jgi:asparagine synthase (glutamine-hydrolysing)
MCGIFGFSGFEEEGLLQKMGQTMQHRGPDGAGCYDEPGFHMGMVRLSIIDLHGGWQPIYNEDRSAAIVLNGEIYNYKELRTELEAHGHVFSTQSDTETILHGWEQWGITGVLSRLNGMFAFCIRDIRKGEFFIARDRCGQKPLYWHQENGRLLFASEAKSLLRSQYVSAQPNLAAVDAYLGLRNVPEPSTMFEGIHKLPAAHYIHGKRDGSLSFARYWDISLAKGDAYKSDDAYFEEFEALWTDTMQLHMRSDVPVGAYLSGGVDSSLVVAGMMPFAKSVNTYSIGFGSPIDETKDAADTARFLGTNHHEIICEASDFDLLRKIVWHMDRPVGDALIIAFYKLAEGASKDLKVVLGGEGADEIFAGYSFQKVQLKVEQVMRKFGPLGPAALKYGAANVFAFTPHSILNKFFEFPADLGSQGKKRVVDFLRHYGGRNRMENFVALRTLWAKDERRAIYSDSFKNRVTDSWIPPLRDTDGPFLDTLLKLQFDEWLQDWALIRQDKNTMAHSLEYRLPFLDHRLIELGFRMPPHLKVQGKEDKWIERRLADKYFAQMPKNKPGHRPKIPFFLPLEFFFQHPQFQALVADTLSESSLKRRGYFDPKAVRILLEKMQTREFIYLKQVMSLVILELWHRVFVDGESVD